MRTILISGTAQTKPYRISNCSTGFKVQYNVWIWAARENEPIQLVKTLDVLLCGHGDLWTIAKAIAHGYFNDEKFEDGAYTTYLDHLIPYTMNGYLKTTYLDGTVKPQPHLFSVDNNEPTTLAGILAENQLTADEINALLNMQPNTIIHVGIVPVKKLS